MSYQVLARKWRPANFAELVGQSHVLRALSSALDNERLHHAYLFTGTRGVGKTTIARILARCLNCEQGISSKPCGSCSSCMEINEGRFVDLIEVDAASRTKVEDTRDLLENVQYRPTRGRYKVYLIDEVHMLSNHSFNALLKTLEEPPPHVVFLLATTDPQKLPATVLSRCLQFHLKNMQPEDITQHLAHILESENIVSETPALESLAWSAKGSMRDALSLLDQAIAFGDGKVLDKDVRDMLGTIDRDQVYRILSALANSDGILCLQIIEELSQFAPDYDDVLAELLAVLHRVALIQQIPTASIATQELQQIEQLASSIAAEDIQLFYQLGLHGRRDLSLAPDKRSGFEMCILRMLSFRPELNKGAPPVKKPESSIPLAATAAVESSQSSIKNNQSSVDTIKAVTAIKEPSTVEEKPLAVNVELVEEPSAITEESSAVVDEPHAAVEQASIDDAEREIPDFSFTDTDQDDQSYHDPREQLTTATEPTEPTEQASQVQYVSGPLKSPLLRDRNKHQQKPTSEVATNTKLEEKASSIVKPQEEIVETVEQPEVQQTLPTPQAATEIVSEITDIKQAEKADDGLPQIDNISQENWYCVIERLSVTGVTEQIVLNSQFISFTDDVFQLSLVNNIRSMVSNEHLNKLTAAINEMYNSCYTISISEQEPEYETPRQRRERIKQERHQVACENLTNDPQVQAILNTFSATLDQESVITLLPE